MTDRAAWKPALDPELLPLVEALPSLNLNDETLAAVRSISLRPPFEPSGQVEVTDHIVDPATGLTVRVSRPTEIEGPFGCLYGMHGGGLVVGSAVQYDEIFDRWCPRFGIVGVSVEYRLAPETPYPGPSTTVRPACSGWSITPPNSVSIRSGSGSQESAPAVGCAPGWRSGCVTGAGSSRRSSCSTARCSTTGPSRVDDAKRSARLDGGLQSLRLGRLPRRAGGERRGPRDGVAGAEPDLSGLPPTYLCVGGADGFVDEDVEYAMRLSAAGVPTDFQVHAGLPHGVMVFGNTDAATRYLAGQEAWLAGRFGRRLSA
ncbi:MAG: alpha/beta hydrolase [Ilumatobacteraceae bacterium]